MGMIIQNGVLLSSSKVEIQPAIYSEDEREIGVFRDGKPLYERCLVFTSALTLQANTWTQTAFAQGDLDRIVSARISDTAGACADNIACGFVSNYIALNSPRNVQFNEGSYLIIRYTKTTDTAGSGVWATTGLPAHHYSTSEQIVGTWIDGKTLYEKVVTKTINCDSETTVFSTADVPNLNEIISVIGRLGPTLLNNYDTTNYRSYTDVSGTTIKCYCKWGSTSTVEARLIVRYTKSS